MSQPTSLYRFYDSAGVLLYVGITYDMYRRFGDHGTKKVWHPLAAKVTITHYPTRDEAAEAERKAIAAEGPLYNIQHNQRRHLDAPDPAYGAKGRWEFRSRRSGYRKQCDLFLYPELDGSSMVDAHYRLDGEGQLREYLRYLERNHPEWLEADAVPIYWSVISAGGKSVWETAPPFLPGIYPDRNHFLTYYEQPRDVSTHEPVNWFGLPVVNERFPAFAEALGWTPSAFQAYCPLATIMEFRGWPPGRSLP